ncbi:MAG: hypothetical protein ACYSWQ_13275 [Planctomycetota bacterium]|jgi:hypothetical protein
MPVRYQILWRNLYFRCVLAYMVKGGRWRFQQLFSQVSVEVSETILMTEKSFGMQLRDYAARISKERYVVRQDVLNRGSRPAKNPS